MKFCSIISLRRYFFPLLCLVFFQSLHAQVAATSSPYSRFAVGRPEYTGFSSIMAVGGSYTAFQNDSTSPYFINQGNPASYAFNKITSYEFGARYAFYKFSDANNNVVPKQNGGFNYISLAFPVRKRMGAAFGLLPFSNVGYNITTYENVDNIGQIKNNFQGSGGINQLYGGLAIRPFEANVRRFYHSHTYDTLLKAGRSKAIARRLFWRNAFSTLSIGANTSFMYGTITYATRKYFPGSIATVFNTKDYTETQMHDVYFQGGTQMTFAFNRHDKKNRTHTTRLTLGYSVSLPKSMSVSYTHLASNFLLGTYGDETPIDTFSYQPNAKGRIFLPLMHSVGIAIRPGESLLFLLDAGYQQWSKFSFLGDNQNLQDQYRFSGGIQYQPKRDAIGPASYFKHIIYRVGGRYNTGYMFLHGTHIAEYGISAGLGIPIGRRYWSIVNISAEYGKAGTMQNNLVEERFLRFVVGFTFNDVWFIKPKYD